MTIDIDQPAPAARPRRHWWAVTAAAIACILLGADLANRMTPTPVPPAAPQLHTVVMTWTGQPIYAAMIGPTVRAGLPAGVPMYAPAGTTILVIVIGTTPGEVKCGISIDGAEGPAMNGYGVGAIAQCSVTIRDRPTTSGNAR